MVKTAEHAIPVPRNHVIEKIQDRRRHHTQQGCRLPRPSKLPGDEQGGATLAEQPGVGLAVIRDDVKGRQLVRVATHPLDGGPADAALERRERKHPAMVVLEQELQQPITQPANAVVEHQVSTLGGALFCNGNHALILMNMFTENVKTPRKRGRPPGETSQGAAARERLYSTAIGMIASRGYEATTLRDIAAEAGVSVGLLYRYFPSKQAVVMALYDELSAEYARQALSMAEGRWRDRFLFSLRTSLRVLEPHQPALRALTPILVGNPEEGIFSPRTAFSRLRVQHVFEHAVSGATDAPSRPLAEALGRLLYLIHLAVLLWWLLDKSSHQRATDALVSLTQQLLPSAALALHVRPVRKFVVSVDELLQDALFGSPIAE